MMAAPEAPRSSVATHQRTLGALVGAPGLANVLQMLARLAVVDVTRLLFLTALLAPRLVVAQAPLPRAMP